MTSPDVVVVGGGFAGLSAASRLAASGARVLVVEARAQLGGRATAFTDRATGELVDNGQHVLFGCYRETFDFLRRVNAIDNVRFQRSLRIRYVDTLGRPSDLTCPPLPAPLHLLGAVLDWDPMPWRDRLSVLRLAGPLRRARRELRKTGAVTITPPATVSEWLRAHRQGRKLTSWLWEPLAVAALNQAPEHASAAPFVRVLAEMFGDDETASALVLPVKPLHQMYAEPARAFIEAHGGSVRVNALARVIAGNGRVEGIEIRGERVAAPRVIAAVPWFGLRALFGATAPSILEPTFAAADGMESQPIVTVNLWYDRRVMDDAFVGLPGRRMQWVFDKRVAFAPSTSSGQGPSTGSGQGASHLSLVSSGATALTSLSNEELTAMAAAEVSEAFPAARQARLLRATAVREKQATFSLAPGQPPRPPVTTGVEGLWLAGDWIDTGLPSTIESAVLSGHRAALAALAR
ncbi:MAG TPA: hydroxysqualene dehydroxylase HpnE [Vicinamibacterales bacterium]